MIIVKATPLSERGEMPPTEVLEAMGAFTTALADAGVLLAAEGLHPSAEGSRLAFSDKRRHWVDGPFTETKELIGGFWLLQVASRQEAVAWMDRCPKPAEGDCAIELRQVLDQNKPGCQQGAR